MSYSYYDNGNRKSVTDPEGATTSYEYDGKNRLKTATTEAGTPQAKTTTYSYFPDDLLQSVSYPNAVTAIHAYDSANRLTSLTNTRAGATISAYAYTYDDNGNRETQVETNGGTTETTTYGYDALNRLAHITYPADGDYPGGREVGYDYDDVGNRVGEQTTVPGGSGAPLADKRGIFDSLNRLTELQDLVDSDQSQSFEWDANGNQVSKTVGIGPDAITSLRLRRAGQAGREPSRTAWSWPASSTTSKAAATSRSANPASASTSTTTPASSPSTTRRASRPPSTTTAPTASSPSPTRSKAAAGSPSTASAASSI